MPSNNNETALQRAVGEKLGVTRPRVIARVQKLRSTLPMSRAEALGVLGHEVGLHVHDFLTDPTVERVTSLIAQLGRTPVTAAPIKTKPAAIEASDPSAIERLRRELRAAERRAPFSIADDELRTACLDLLNAKGRFDRAVNQAMVVLEDRVRRTAELSNQDFGQPLFGTAIGDAGPLLFSTELPEQRSARMLFMGLYGFFRNPTGHRLGHTYGRGDAAAVVMFVDYLLRLVAAAAAK